jgi:uncharacterized membrane protein
VTTMVVAVIALAVINIVYKGVGPIALGDREFPPRLQAVTDAFGPALLAGLVVVELAHNHWTDFDWTVLPGLVAAAIGWRFKLPDLACIAVAVVVTIAVRLVVG